MIMKKLLSSFLAIAFIVSISPLACAADTATDSCFEPTPYSYEEVVDYFERVDYKESISLFGSELTYYFGDNFAILEDGNTYYLAVYNPAAKSLTLNGLNIDFVSVSNSDSVVPYSVSANRITYPTPWYTEVDTTQSFDIGGMTVSLILTAVGAVFAWPALVSALATVGAGWLSGVAPAGFWLTLYTFRESRTVAPGYPIQREYHEIQKGWFGSHQYDKADQFLDSENTYTDLIYD